MNAAWQDGPPFDDFEGPYRPSIESATSLRDQLLLGAAAAVLCSAASLIVAFARRVASGAPATCVPGQTGEGDHSGQQQRHADEQDPLLAEAAASSRPPPPPPQRWLSDEDRDPRGPWPAADAADGERAGDQAQRLLLPAPSRRTPRSEQPLQFWSHQSDSARTPERGQRDAKQRDAKHQQQQQQQPVRRPFTFRAPGLGDAQPGRDDFGAPQWGRERPFDALARGAERRTSRRPSENMAAHANGFGRRHEDGPEIVDFTPPRQGEGWDPDLLHRWAGRGQRRAACHAHARPRAPRNRARKTLCLAQEFRHGCLARLAHAECQTPAAIQVHPGRGGDQQCRGPAEVATLPSPCQVRTPFGKCRGGQHHVKPAALTTGLFCLES